MNIVDTNITVADMYMHTHTHTHTQSRLSVSSCNSGTLPHCVSRDQLLSSDGESEHFSASSSPDIGSPSELSGHTHPMSYQWLSSSHPFNPTPHLSQQPSHHHHLYTAGECVCVNVCVSVQHLISDCVIVTLYCPLFTGGVFDLPSSLLEHQMVPPTPPHGVEKVFYPPHHLPQQREYSHINSTKGFIHPHSSQSLSLSLSLHLYLSLHLTLSPSLSPSLSLSISLSISLSLSLSLSLSSLSLSLYLYLSLPHSLSLSISLSLCVCVSVCVWSKLRPCRLCCECRKLVI